MAIVISIIVIIVTKAKMKIVRTIVKMIIVLMISKSNGVDDKKGDGHFSARCIFHNKHPARSDFLRGAQWK